MIGYEAMTSESTRQLLGQLSYQDSPIAVFSSPQFISIDSANPAYCRLTDERSYLRISTIFDMVLLFLLPIKESCQVEMFCEGVWNLEYERRKKLPYSTYFSDFLVTRVRKKLEKTWWSNTAS